ncbi:unnamed protein product, partial [Prorocentrum cordatum]
AGVVGTEKLVELRSKDSGGSAGSAQLDTPTGRTSKESDTEEKQSNWRDARLTSQGGKGGLWQDSSGADSTGISSFMHWLVMRPAFDLFFGVLILLNTIGMVIEEQFNGAQVGYSIGFYEYYGSDEWAQHTYPESWFHAGEVVFACLFSVEVILRMLGMGFRFFRRPVEVFDLVVVILSDLSVAFSSSSSTTFEDVELLRLLRAAKLLRLLKLVRAIEGFDALHLMMTALMSSTWALCWSVLLLLSIMTFIAMITTNLFRALYLEDDNQTLSDENKEYLFQYWGTFGRSMLSLFELALANWTPICRWLMDNLHEAFMVAALSFKLVMGIAVATGGPTANPPPPTGLLDLPSQPSHMSRPPSALPCSLAAPRFPAPLLFHPSLDPQRYPLQRGWFSILRCFLIGPGLVRRPRGAGNSQTLPFFLLLLGARGFGPLFFRREGDCAALSPYSPSFPGPAHVETMLVFIVYRFSMMYDRGRCPLTH